MHAADDRSPDPAAADACSNKTQGGQEVAPVERERRRRPETAAERPRKRRSDIPVYWRGWRTL
jgi:hypothetical protein